MATALQGLRLTARTCCCTQSSQKHVVRTIGRQRVFSTTPIPWVSKEERQKRHEERLSRASKITGLDVRAMDRENEDMKRELQQLLDDEIDIGPSMPIPDLPVSRKKLKETFLNLGEQEAFEDGGFMEDEEDDISTLAHGELEQHREWRHYARLEAWEMPLLSKLAKPFELPTKRMPLRFRYTTYMGEQHPAEKKVVLEFSPADMPDLTPVQTDKLRKLLGPRYNPEKDTVRMSCEMYETQAQNKRYLGDTVDALLAEARDPTDTFEDVPLDTRHHTFKPRLRFPKEWAMTEERRQELVAQRQAQIERDAQLQELGHLVNGGKKISVRR
ncbi:putative 37S ribosomal protein S24, mitochondrial [Glarea lozoyensis 74030]|uniref:Putative 37S ribosomal protein S24, mitochondrial n=1 Tax=Glarea lozoyensis (strain ATCC 74030 / MF5533) TaxID=1104152 RepID=H0ENE6_GLAL7|nr:putative 37S ribosomal protein S24, mitochondrial [Glarea lozoyensis 74030]